MIEEGGAVRVRILDENLRIVLIEVEQNLSKYTSELLYQNLEEKIQEGYRKFIVDLHDVEEKGGVIDSEGIVLLWSYLNKFQSGEGRMVFVVKKDKKERSKMLDRLSAKYNPYSASTIDEALIHYGVYRGEKIIPPKQAENDYQNGINGIDNLDNGGEDGGESRENTDQG